NISVRVLHPSKTIRREELKPYQPIANLDALAERSSAKQRRRDLRFPILRRCRFPVRRSMKNRVKRMILCRDTSIRSLPVELQRQSRNSLRDKPRAGPCSGQAQNRPLVYRLARALPTARRERSPELMV